MFGMKDEEAFLASSLADLSAERQPDGRLSGEKAGEMIQTALSEGSRYFRWTHRRSNGEEFPCTVLLSRTEWGGKVLVQGTVRDITEEIQREEQSRQAQKMEALGQFAGGVAHDFNNILGSSMMNLVLLLDTPQLDDETSEGLKELSADSERAATLVRQLLLYSRKSVMDVRVVSLGDIAARMLKMLNRLLGEHVKLTFEPESDLPPIEADEGMMEQVVMNLCVNARDAMPDGGRIGITVEAVEIESGNHMDNPDRRSGRHVRLVVGDTGCGMDHETLRHVFDPFYTTKEVGKGTGMGMATVYGIVDQHNGWIEIDSREGAGTTVSVYLRATSKSASDREESRPREDVRGSETILVVEDEEGVRRSLVRSLNSQGYRVLEAENGPQALALWREHGAEIDLLFTDMVIPEGMTGWELAEKLRGERPDLRVVIASGYNTEMVGHGKAAAAGMSYLAKPFSASVVGKTVRDCLDGQPA